MKSDIAFYIQLAVSMLPFLLFAFLNARANVDKEIRNRQYLMPLVAVVYSIVLLIFLSKISDFLSNLILQLADTLEEWGKQLSAQLNAQLNAFANQMQTQPPQDKKITFLFAIAEFLRNLYKTWGIYLQLVLFNSAAMLGYAILKRVLTAVFAKIKIRPETLPGKISDLFYTYDAESDRWFIKDHFGQARTFIKTAYFAGCVVMAVALFVSCELCKRELISAPFYPIFAAIIIGELAFFIDGLRRDEDRSDLSVQADKSTRVAMYPLLRKPLKALFGDKLSEEGTTVNVGGINGGAVEDILAALEQDGGHVGKNYATFIRRKMDMGLKPNVDYVRCGYDLAVGKSLLFNTPFYDKINPYAFYAMNRALLTGGKILFVLGRHSTEDDLKEWCEEGMRAVSNVPNLWKIETLSGKKRNDETLPDIGVISRSGVHDLDIHKNNRAFLKKVSFVFLVEPSRLVTTAQIGLNLLIKCCGSDRAVTFCSVDRNCDGLVDALSHILMTNITEVSATEYPHGASSYMYWTADDDYLQHRILPGVSRYLGMGTELSMVALKNQVKRTVWYGGEAYPVVDARWIAKQYYHDLLDYAQLPTNQQTFDSSFTTSFNLCNERVSDYSFITVEDDRNNLFETRRNFATIAEQQGFVNVISSEYLLREYMSANPELFTADAKAIPYITADYARTRRNAILSLCLLLCVDVVKEDTLHRQAAMLNLDTKDPVAEFWKELCTIFGSADETDRAGNPILVATAQNGETILFKKDETILFKREYRVESGKFESVYVIENTAFSRIILDDLQNASYIAEQESKDVYLGTELKGHVYQKYMPGQLFTLNGKYYEMVSTTADDRILVRRASEHIGGRLAYRQVRNYTIHRLEDSSAMGALKTVNDIDIHYQYADFSVATPGYWKLRAYNDFDSGDLVAINGVPNREYHHKQVLKFDFSKLGDAFTDSVRMTLTNLLNEVFVTLFAENQSFISAVTPGCYDAPLTYSLAMDEGVDTSDKCIFIIEDSQLDIGLLVAVERSINRIFQIVSDYLTWNEEQIAESIRIQNTPAAPAPAPINVYEAEESAEKGEKDNAFKKFGRRVKGVAEKVGNWIKGLFKKKPQKPVDDNGDNLTPKERKKAGKAAKKEARKAAKEAKKAAREERKKQKKAAKEKGQEEPVEETVEDPVEETVEEPVEEETVEEPVEETDETAADEEGVSDDA